MADARALPGAGWDRAMRQVGGEKVENEARDGWMGGRRTAGRNWLLSKALTNGSQPPCSVTFSTPCWVRYSQFTSTPVWTSTTCFLTPEHYESTWGATVMAAAETPFCSPPQPEPVAVSGLEPKYLRLDYEVGPSHHVRHSAQVP